MQGILHELYGDEFVFTRDYLSKDGEDTSLYPTIVDFIKEAAFQVDRAQIQKHFPGVPDIVIQFAIESPEIINCFGKYIHASKLRISESEREYLKQNIDAIIADGAQHHIKELYNLVSIERPEIFTRNGVFYPFSAYSLIEYLSEMTISSQDHLLHNREWKLPEHRMFCAKKSTHMNPTI